MIPSHIRERLEAQINEKYGHLIEQYDDEPRKPSRRVVRQATDGERVSLEMSYRQKQAFESSCI